MATQLSLQDTADHLRFSQMIWFSRPGSGDAIRAVTAAFEDFAEAFGWAQRHPGDFVHFPNGTQLNAGIAARDGSRVWEDRAHAPRMRS